MRQHGCTGSFAVHVSLAAEATFCLFNGSQRLADETTLRLAALKQGRQEQSNNKARSQRHESVEYHVSVNVRSVNRNYPLSIVVLNPLQH
jgi:hypothetical protein